jgi:hypothetical protein
VKCTTVHTGKHARRVFDWPPALREPPCRKRRPASIYRPTPAAAAGQRDRDRRDLAARDREGHAEVARERSRDPLEEGLALARLGFGPN